MTRVRLELSPSEDPPEPTVPVMIETYHMGGHKVAVYLFGTKVEAVKWTFLLRGKGYSCSFVGEE